MTKPLVDLGWLNEGGKTRETIENAVEICKAYGHTSHDEDISCVHGYDHIVYCDDCGYSYHYDSSD